MRYRRVLILGAVLAALFGGSTVLVRAGVMFNHSPSLPIGFYRTQRDRLDRGDLVLACLPENASRLGLERGYLRVGLCPSGAEPVGKRLAAIPGDRFSIDADGIRVNDELLAYSAPQPSDHNAQIMPTLRLVERTLTPAEVLLYRDLAESYDSRYYGAIPLTLVQARLEPLWTWGGESAR
jgi:conjugative transfer signal peptidase TraF